MREPGERVHAAALALAQHGVEDGGTLPGLRRADEEVVHAAYGDGVHGAPHGVVVDWQAGVCEPAFERVAALEGVVYRIPVLAERGIFGVTLCGNSCSFPRPNPAPLEHYILHSIPLTISANVWKLRNSAASMTTPYSSSIIAIVVR